MDNEELALHLRQLEMELLSGATRANPRRLNYLIADEYLEIGKSGKTYTKTEVIGELINEDYKGIDITDFKMTPITGTVALTIFTAHHNQPDNSAAIRSIRSSLWRFDKGRWRIIFHQGTLTTE